MSYQFLEYIPPRASYPPMAVVKPGRKDRERDRDRPSLGLKPRCKASSLALNSTGSPSTSGSSSSVSIINRSSNSPVNAHPSPTSPRKEHLASVSSTKPSAITGTITGTTLRPRPIPNSYWATPLLLACEYPFTPFNPHKPKLDALLRAGVRTFIDLTEDGELVPYSDVLSQRCQLLNIEPSQVEYHRFPIRDRCLPSSLELMYSVLDILRQNAVRGRISAVHCRGGIGRTGMVIGCWLVESGVAKNGAEALEIIAREWKGVQKCSKYPNSPETGDQFDFVYRFCPKVALTAVKQALIGET
ncbi:protein-tyrosine phosphatase-like protein [Crepidotus variabilis]|uniref:Protein-tyrosine phosphatase-like protein n=1 Tax=Crepidotus variabilis TaxID=179855 RepID=A0A9P6JPU5_9AGAR|nr:protein-tyrosine phosphatase-like protein [Crepidotus variabilis]